MLKFHTIKLDHGTDPSGQASQSHGTVMVTNQ